MKPTIFPRFSDRRIHTCLRGLAALVLSAALLTTAAQAGYHVTVASGIPRATADHLKTDIEKEGYTNVVVTGSGDACNVTVGDLPSEGKARALSSDLEKSGFTPGEISSTSPFSDSSSSVYRILVAEFPSRNAAEGARSSLRQEGFTNVDISEENGKFRVLLGTFNQQAEAEKLLSDARAAGFALASITTEHRMSLPSSGVTKPVDLPANLTTAQQKQTRDLLQLADKAERGEASAEEIRTLKNSIQQLSDNQQKILNQFESSRQVGREAQQKIYQDYRQFDSLVLARQYDKAQAILDKVRALDPNEPYLASKVSRLASARGEASGAPPSSPSAPATAKPDPEKVQALINQARQLEAEGKSDQAKARYQAALSIDPTNSEAKSKVVELARNASSASVSAPSSSKNNLYYLSGGLLVLVAGFFTWLKLRSRRHGAETHTPSSSTETFIDPLATPQALSSPGHETFDTSPLAESQPEPVASASSPVSDISSFATVFPSDDEEEEEPAPKPVAKPEPVEPESDTVSLSGFSIPQEPTEPASTQSPVTEEEPVSSSVESSADSGNIPDINLADIPSPEPEREESPAASSRSALSDDIDIEALMKSTFSEAKNAIAGKSPSSQEEPPAEPPVSEPPSIEQPAAPEQSQPASAPSGVLFQEDFDALPAGSQPSQWVGNFENATLTVVDESPNGSGGKSLRFEKTAGNGSASYHCQFPKAAGKIVAEFDIRCDDKNKYLLGIYLEQDEDFKQSVHTIIHRLDERTPPMLRLQGEPVPYELGSWRRIRFELDTLEGTMSSYTDGTPVVENLRLPSPPAYINTLSIRDNLATTGILYIDNIRISQG